MRKTADTRLNDDLPLLRPDEMTMGYINALKKEILKKEIFRVAVCWAVLALLAIKVKEYNMYIDEIFGSHEYVLAFLAVLAAAIPVFVVNRLRKLSGDSSEYGYVDGAVVSCYKKLFGLSAGVDIRQEYVNILSDYGNVYNEIPVFKPFLFFISSHASELAGTKLVPGDSVRIIRINKRTVFAVELMHEFTPKKRKDHE